MKYRVLLLFGFSLLSLFGNVAGLSVYNNLRGVVPDCADPYVLYHDGKYYLYGTGGDDGIKVYVSDNMTTWSGAAGATNGYALHKNDVFGNKWFWAPEVYYIDGRFYMFYSAEERISVAESNSPLGPFTQPEDLQKPLHNTGEIDTHLFIDDDGKKYLYYVRFTNGNEIWVAELDDDMHAVKEETLTRCLGTRDVASQPWEHATDKVADVAEGPFVLKHNGVYYLTYSANHYESKKYAVGYATSDSPMGPWKRYAGNPILIGNDKITGTGHHSFITLPSGCNVMVYHAHNTPQSVQPRKMCLDTYEFVPSETPGEPDIIQVNGPTTTNQELCSDEGGGTGLGETSGKEINISVSGNTLMVQAVDLQTKEISVLGMNGAAVLERSFAGSTEQKLPQGTYIVEVRNAGETGSFRTKVIIK